MLNRLALAPGEYYLVSMHREENIDGRARLQELLGAMTDLGRVDGRRVVVTTHPRLRNRLEALGDEVSALELHEPFAYFDYNKLQRNARCVLSDSGTISEEAALSGFPAVTIRDSMERPEALDTGAIVLTGIGKRGIARAVTQVVEQWQAGDRPATPRGYEDTNFSLRVVRLVSSLVAMHKNWLGLH